MLAEIHHSESPASAPALGRLQTRLRTVLVEVFGLSAEEALPKPTLVQVSGQGMSIEVTAVQLSAGKIEDPARRIQSDVCEVAAGTKLKVRVICAEGVFVAA